MIGDKIKKIYKIKNFNYLLKEEQGTDRVSKYYNTNKIAYRLFHNKQAFLHMGISNSNTYHKKDLLKQAKYISEYIVNNKAKSVMELGYGRGANLCYLSKICKGLDYFGVDISTKPLKRYKKENIIYKKQDFHNLEEHKNTLDLIYAIETICHSNNLKKLFSNISLALKSGGYFIIFDGYYLVNKDNLDDDFKIACTLVEKGMAVDEFNNLSIFKKIAQENGLVLQKEIDFSENIKPSLYRLQKTAKIYLKFPVLAKIINFLLPEIFIRNFLSGYLMPDLVESDIAGYYMHVFKKE